MKLIIVALTIFAFNICTSPPATASERRIQGTAAGSYFAMIVELAKLGSPNAEHRSATRFENESAGYTKGNVYVRCIAVPDRYADVEIFCTVSEN